MNAPVHYDPSSEAWTKPLEDFLAALSLVEPEIADQWLGELEMLEEAAGAPGIFGRNHVALFESADRSEGHVLQVANGRGNQVEGSRGERWQGCFHVLGQFGNKIEV